MRLLHFAYGNIVSQNKKNVNGFSPLTFLRAFIANE